jgi:hypothetical protein
MMFEIGVFLVILFALGYWATLFIMGRREDVLHGEFVEAEPEAAAAPAGRPMPVAETPFVPGILTRSALPPVPAPLASVAEPPPATVVRAPERPANLEALQSLLVSIKQELKNAAQI